MDYQPAFKLVPIAIILGLQFLYRQFPLPRRQTMAQTHH
jgi:hypothetical protein